MRGTETAPAANPPVCGAELAMPEGRARCEFPRGHVGPHRASGPPHAPRDGLTVWWGEGLTERLLSGVAARPLDAA